MDVFVACNLFGIRESEKLHVYYSRRLIFVDYTLFKVVAYYMTHIRYESIIRSEIARLRLDSDF